MLSDPSHDPAIVLRQILEHADEIRALVAAAETPRLAENEEWGSRRRGCFRLRQGYGGTREEWGKTCLD